MAKKFKAEVVSDSPDDYPKKTNSTSGFSSPNSLSDKFAEGRKKTEETRSTVGSSLVKEFEKEQAKIDDKADRTAKGCVGWAMLIGGICFAPMLIGIPFAIVGALMLMFPKWSYWDS
tara:strand:- start:958 stop:1308 length:351 start_codon:yes stop_codon:yes gene_type:complete